MKSTVEELVRRKVRDLKPYQSARDVVRHGLLLDANENPFSHDNLGISVNRYPDPHQLDLRGALAHYLDLSVENVLAGCGSDEVLDWIFKVFCEPGCDRVAIAEPTYGMYRVMAEIFGVPVHEILLDENFEIDTDSFLSSVPADVKVLFICSPNNPTGNLLGAEEILSLVSRWPGIVVVDEAYIEFAGGPSLCPEVRHYPNLVVMRTFSKALGRAGFRLGYAVAGREIIDYFSKVKAPYNLSALTQVEGRRVLNNLQDLKQEVAAIVAERCRVEKALAQAKGVERVYPSEANFLLFRCRDATRICERLLQRGIVVRDRSFLPGLQDCIRVTIGMPDENTQFLENLANCFEEVEA